MEEKQYSNYKLFEWFGVITAIIYSLFVALNIGLEFFGFMLLLISAISIGIWAFLNHHKGILLLQFFYTASALIGLVRWWH
tara:strand:+ start:357 stop:599 length:243 start_codon:yes stop_codon:yes gene_type:complete